MHAWVESTNAAISSTRDIEENASRKNSIEKTLAEFLRLFRSDIL